MLRGIESFSTLLSSFEARDAKDALNAREWSRISGEENQLYGEEGLYSAYRSRAGGVKCRVSSVLPPPGTPRGSPAISALGIFSDDDEI